jgi:hypothetical protein
MGLAGYKGTKEANGTSYIPIARAVSEARTEATPVLPKAHAVQGHKRAISSMEDAVNSEAKKARINSPLRDTRGEAESVKPVSTAPAEASTPALDRSTRDVSMDQGKSEVAKQPTPASPEPDVITEAVSGVSVAVQPPREASPKTSESANVRPSATPLKSTPSAATPSEPPKETSAAVESTKPLEGEPNTMEVDKN